MSLPNESHYYKVYFYEDPYPYNVDHICFGKISKKSSSEKIKRFNQPYCKVNNKTERKEKSSSTTKLRSNNATKFQMKNFDKNEVKSMPEIQTAAKTTVYIKSKKSNLTKLPKL